MTRRGQNNLDESIYSKKDMAPQSITHLFLFLTIRHYQMYIL